MKTTEPNQSPGESQKGSESQKLTWGGQASAEAQADHRYVYQ